MYINKAIIFGNVTRDPEMRALPSGIQVATLSIATNRTWKDKSGAKQESVDYHNVVVFGKQAELVNQYIKKGSSLYIEGRIQTRSWDDKDGTKKYRTEIVADVMQFGPRSASTPSNYSAGSSGTTASTASKPKSASAKSENSTDESPDSIEYPEEDINVDDIPF